MSRSPVGGAAPRYPKLSEKIHSERNWLRCKADWVAHAVELENAVDSFQAQRDEARAALARIAEACQTLGLGSLLLQVEPPTDGRTSGPIDCKHLNADRREDGWHCRGCGLVGNLTLRDGDWVVAAPSSEGGQR